MICPNCKSTIDDEALVCPSCKDDAAKKLQEQKKNEAKLNIKLTIERGMRSPLFLISLICMLVLGVSLMYNGIMGFEDVDFTSNAVFFNVLGPSIPVTFGLLFFISGIAMLKSYIKKDGFSNGVRIMANCGSGVMNGASVIICIIAAILAIAILIIGFTVADFGNQMGDTAGTVGGIFDDIGEAGAEGGEVLGDFFEGLEEFLAASAAMAIIVSILIAVILMFVSINLSITYSRINKYYYVLQNASNSLQYYKMIAPPKVRAYIFGVLMIVIGVLSMADVISATVCICIGLYTLLTGIWFNKMHRNLLEAQNDVSAAQKRYDEIVNETRIYRERLYHEERRRRIEEQEEEERKAAAKKKEEEERLARRREEIELNQQQQQLMMQQMMQQMMANMNNNFNSTSNENSKLKAEKEKSEEKSE